MASGNLAADDVKRIRELLTHAHPAFQRQGVELARAAGDWTPVLEGCVLGDRFHPVQCDWGNVNAAVLELVLTAPTLDAATCTAECSPQTPRGAPTSSPPRPEGVAKAEVGRWRGIVVVVSLGEGGSEGAGVARAREPQERTAHSGGASPLESPTGGSIAVAPIPSPSPAGKGAQGVAFCDTLPRV